MNKAFEWDKWMREIPAINFPQQYAVRVIPPFGGAIIRFCVKSGNGSISVYLDAYDQLGCMNNKPYWEIYPAASGDPERFDMDDTAGLLNGIKLSLQRQNRDL